jgi:hypothetical protein
MIDLLAEETFQCRPIPTISLNSQPPNSCQETAIPKTGKVKAGLSSF